MIVFRGVFAESLGGFLTVRGYAKLSELSEYSLVDKAYQRKLKKDHKKEIEQFYERGEYLFYPEIVLSLEMKVDFEMPDAHDGRGSASILRGKTFKSNVNGVEIQPTKTRSAGDLQRVNIKLHDEKQKPFKRIDGNHRLSAYEAIASDQTNDRLAPFCILLFDQGDSEHYEKALFYNINSKAKPLTSEEVYRGIIDDPAGFPDDVLERDFGHEFVLCRHLIPQLNFDYLTNLCAVLGQYKGGEDCRRSIFIKALQTFRKYDTETPLPTADNLFKAVQSVNFMYADDRFKTNTSPGFFAACLHFGLKDGNLPTMFLNWAVKNHIYELQEITALGLIRIFEKIVQAKKRQIFVSMQFSDDTRANYEAIKAAVEDVNNEHQLEIKLRQIRIDQFDAGFSYSINDEILRLIEESGLLIADLTHGNKNVYHEIGYLMGLNQGQGLPHDNFILLHNGSIGDDSKDIGFNLSGIKQLRVTDTNNLREQIKVQIKAYYGLGG